MRATQQRQASRSASNPLHCMGAVSGTDCLQALSESVAKTNYFRKLNEIAMEKRMRIRHGDLAPCSDKIKIGPSVEGGFRLISELNIMANFRVLDHIKFAH